ncbi:hypothetical protein U9M48_018459 [Paspalum notatum var. saurae]|uniref:F-box domain-containing protein n=1 Tax=Paspalum notatum var. saurae TaxID=547442 RepID=A0AAQ3TD51_PASNO
MATVLQKFLHADQWKDEDIVGRLGMVMHAAFLFAGFQPYGAQPPRGRHLLKRAGEAGSLCLYRWYTAPQLARREGADAVVLMVRARGRDVALLMFPTAGRGDSAYLERLDAGTVAPLLSRALGDTEPWGSRICCALANAACGGLLAELCGRNGLPLPGFMSLPDDIKVEILKRLAGKDLARVELTCRQLRRLVAERDVELWKPLYDGVRPRRLRGIFSTIFFFGWKVEALSWKEKFVEARPPSWDDAMWRPMFFDFYPAASPPIRVYASVSKFIERLQDLPPEEEAEEVSARGESTGGGHRRNDHKKTWHRPGTGAIHSPSSRYRWKHR